MELPDGDITPLLEHLDNCRVHQHLARASRPSTSRRGVPSRTSSATEAPPCPSATWTPGEIGVQHMVGTRVTRFLADHGCPVPEEWYVADESPKRGLVLKTYGAPPEQTLRWLVEACRRLCPLEVHLPWQAVVRTALTAPSDSSLTPPCPRHRFLMSPWNRFHGARQGETTGGWWSPSATSPPTPGWAPGRSPGCSTTARRSARHHAGTGPRRHRDPRLPPQPAGPGPLARALPDHRRRRPVLHPRLGRRAAARGRRRARREPLRPRAVQRRVARAPRRALRRAHPAGTAPTACSSCRLPPPPADLERLRRAGVPVVLVDARGDGVPSVSPTTSRAAASPRATSSTSATERIAFIGDDPDNPLRLHRRAPSESAATVDGARRRRASTWRPRPRPPRPARPRRRPAASPRELLALPSRRRRSSPPPTCRPPASSPRPRLAGLRVPDDLSVVGFDDIELSTYVGLTTVRQPLFDSGYARRPLLLEAAGQRRRAGRTDGARAAARARRAADDRTATGPARGTTRGTDEPMAEIVLDDVWKVYPDGTEAVRGLDLDDRRQGVHRPRRAVGLRQDDGAAHGRRARGDLEGHDQHRRPRRQRRAAQRARHRHGVPELRALPAHDGLRQHGVRVEAAEGADATRSTQRVQRGGAHPRSRRAARAASRPRSREASASASPWDGPSCATRRRS